jgi:hypothetical protein
MVTFYILFILINSFFLHTSLVLAEETEFNTLSISVSQQGEEIEINYEINIFNEEPVNINGIEYSIIKIGEESNLLQTGKPNIPTICRSIMIPDTTKMKIEIINAEYQHYENVLIAPSKGNLLRSINPDEVPYEFGEVYTEDAYFPGKLATLREPYIIRDFRGQVIELYPIQYNPVQKTMNFYNKIKIKVYPDGTDTINTIQRTSLPEKIDIDFNIIYEDRFINYKMNGRYDPVLEQGNMLIITYDDFRDNMQTYVDWKILQGIPTDIVKVSTIGDSDAIKTYIHDFYQENDLTFVLLVGDVEQVPTIIISNGIASDTSYTYVVGDDHYPDLFVGRFSAQNTEQLSTMVERSIEYEKNPQIGAEWYNKSIGIASNDTQIGDDDEYDWEHMRNIRSKLMNYTYFIVDELYDGSQGGEDEPGNPTSQMVIDAVNEGRSIINYCGHGNPAKWTSTGFNIADINDLVNDNMLPFVICVACNNGRFDDYDECFCEAWQRATNDETGEPTGAIAVTGSSKDMAWFPPMDAQDEFIDLIIETYEDNIKHTVGGIHFNGVMHMNDEYAELGYLETDGWIVFGDPSLTIRTDSPLEMDVIHETEIEEDSNSFEVTVTGLKGALCALSRAGSLLGYAYTDNSCKATITFDPIQGEEPPLDLVVTAYNKIPYITQIPVDVNKPPEKPTTPMGPHETEIEVKCTFSSNTFDPDGDKISYLFDWGDGTNSGWSEYYNSGERVEKIHYFLNRGYFSVRVKARDIFGMESEWSNETKISVANNPPFKPTILGPRYFLKSGIEYEYVFKARDIDGDNVFIKVIWDDEETEWIGPLNSGESVNLNIIWEKPMARYELNCMARDIFGEESPLATITINTPRNRYSSMNFLENYPLFFNLLKVLLNLISK